MDKKPYLRGRRKRIDAPKQIFSVSDLITVASAVSAITKAVQPKPEDWWRTRDKVWQGVRYAIRVGHLKTDSKDRVIFGELAAWARTKNPWRAKLTGWPRHIQLKFSEELSVSNEVDITAVHYPKTLAESHAEILRLTRELRVANLETQRLREENARLRPTAERYEEICKQNRINAGKPKDV